MLRLTAFCISSPSTGKSHKYGAWGVRPHPLLQSLSQLGKLFKTIKSNETKTKKETEYGRKRKTLKEKSERNKTKTKRNEGGGGGGGGKTTVHTHITSSSLPYPNSNPSHVTAVLFRRIQSHMNFTANC